MEWKENHIITHDMISRHPSSAEVIDRLRLGNQPQFERVIKNVNYDHALRLLQIELIKFQNWVKKEKKRVAIIFEGRDAAGKGGAIRRFTRYLRPRQMHVVALTKPTETEKGQWYFRRYIKELPNEGEIVFFDRSWYNRAVVEPVMGFCTEEEYRIFMRQVPEFEHMLFEDGLHLIKFWFGISKEEQNNRFKSREKDLLKQWKLSPVDAEAQKRWQSFSDYKMKMMDVSHTSYSPWIIISTNDKKRARLESIRYVLSNFDYTDKNVTGVGIYPDPNVVQRFSREMKFLD